MVCPVNIGVILESGYFVTVFFFQLLCLDVVFLRYNVIL